MATSPGNCQKKVARIGGIGWEVVTQKIKAALCFGSLVRRELAGANPARSFVCLFVCLKWDIEVKE